jgi:uncharacterized protein YfaS (alpha-2-macroglobulin family)
MNKKFLILLAIIGIVLFPLSNCQSKDADSAELPDVSPAADKGDLHITNVTPKGKTEAPHEAETIVVIFDQPMVPLEALPEGKGSSFLKLDPSFSGKHRWMGTRILTFTPDELFPYATEIKVAVPARTKSVNGFSLKNDFTWSFKTILPRIVKHFPRKNQKWIKLDSQILLVFNQPVLKEKIKDFLSITGVSKRNIETPVDFRIKSPSTRQLEEEEIKASPDETLLLVPEEMLKPDFIYFVEAKAGVPGKIGPLGMDKNYLYKFNTFKEFKFEYLKSTVNHDPYEPLKFQFTNPVIYKDFIQKIRFEPKVLIPDYYSRWDHGSSSIWLSLPLKPETEYTVWIAPELEDRFRNKLGEEVKIHFSTAPYPPSVRMNTGQGILEAYGDLKYPFYAVNVDEVYLQAAKIKKEDIIPLLTTRRILSSSEKFLRKDFFHLEKTLQISLPRNARKTLPIGLKQLLPEKFGLVFLQLDTYLKEKWNRYPKAFLQVTNLGISAKFSPENNLIWVTELKTGLPVPEAEVELRDDLNKAHWRGRTDKEGKVQTPGSKILKIKDKNGRSIPRQWVIVTHGKDIAFTSSDWGTGIYPYRFGIQYDWNPQPVQYQGYIFTERGIYRAGEDVHVKGIIRRREKGEWHLPRVQEIECEVMDPFRKSYFKRKISLDSYGSFSFDLETDEEASLGHYQIRAKIPLDKEAKKIKTVYGSFRIEAFRPAEFEVHLHTLKESYVFGDEYQAELRASYLFGGAMGGQKVSWYLRLDPAYFSPPGHKGYVFGNQIDRWEDDERERSRLISSGETTLDSDGKLQVKAKLLPEKEKDSVLAALEGTVQGPSSRSISGRIQTLVHRGEYYIGLKPSTTFLRKGKELVVNVISVDPDGKFVPEKKISLKLVKREWESVRKAGIGGRYRWLSQKKHTEVAAHEIQTKNEPVQVSFLPEKSGFYLLKAKGEDRRENNITTTTYCYVTGRDYVPWRRKDDDIVELVADSEDYRPGDKAKIMVKSPYERAKALVTVEREFIMESWVLEIQGSSDQIEIPILSDYIPNVFVSVLLVQGRTSSYVYERNQDIGKPSFKIGYINLNVDSSEKRLDIDIQKDQKSYRPKGKVTLNLRVEDWKGIGTQSCISLAVVDVGVLNLIGYQTPDPFARFYGPKPLSVQTSETRIHVVGQREYGEKGEDVGGGVGVAKEAFAPTLAEIELRGDFKFTAYWNPSLLTDEEGNASVSFTLPDNLTTFRIMAVAQTPDSLFGRAESTFKVSKLLLLQPSLPRFARIGDKFKGGVVVHNYSSKRGDVVLSCEAQGILFQEKNKVRQFSLEPGEGREILFSFEVEKPGKAVFSFRAKMGEETDGLEITLPLKMPRPTETVALFSHTTESTQERIRIPEGIYPSESKIEVQASATALSGLKDCIDYLTDYPYLCLEQRLSSVLPYILAPDVIQDFKLSKFDREGMREYVRKTIKEIYNYQKGNGGFGYWPESPNDSAFITCYAVFALAKAQKMDFKVNKERLQRATEYLKNLLRRKIETQFYRYSKRISRTTKAFALYDLALLDQPEPSYVEKLFEEREEMSLFGQTLLLKALHQGKGSIQAQNTLLRELMNKIKVTPTHAHFEDDEGRDGGWIYSSNTRTTAFILQSMIEVGHDHPLLPAMVRWLVKRREAGHWSSTHRNIFVFYAMNDFYRLYEKIEPDFKVEISLAKKLLLEEIFNIEQRDKVSRAQVSLTHFKPGKTLPLKYKKKGEGTLYYGARMTYAPMKKLPPREEGFTVYKEIKSLDRKPLDSIKAGSLVVVTIQLAIHQESLFVVVEDPLPAGFEAVNPTFVTESEEQQRRLAQLEQQQRRRRWWDRFNHIEMHDDRVLLFADSLTPGIHTHRYLARALTYGTFHAPGTKAEEMYSPEVFGRSQELTVRIEK